MVDVLEDFERTTAGSKWNHLHPLDIILQTTLAVQSTEVLVNTAPCFLRQCKWTSIIIDDPKRLFNSGLSDHGMVQAKASFSAPTKPGEGIPPTFGDGGLTELYPIHM